MRRPRCIPGRIICGTRGYKRSMQDRQAHLVRAVLIMCAVYCNNCGYRICPGWPKSATTWPLPQPPTFALHRPGPANTNSTNRAFNMLMGYSISQRMPVGNKQPSADIMPFCSVTQACEWYLMWGGFLVTTFCSLRCAPNISAVTIGHGRVNNLFRKLPLRRETPNPAHPKSLQT